MAIIIICQGTQKTTQPIAYLPKGKNRKLTDRDGAPASSGWAKRVSNSSQPAAFVSNSLNTRFPATKGIFFAKNASIPTFATSSSNTMSSF